MSYLKFITDALNVFAESTSSFQAAFEDAESFRYFLSGFGWELDPNIDEAGFAKVHEAFGAEISLLEQMDGDDAQRAIAAPGLIACLMTSRAADASWPAPLNSSLFWSEFPQQLLDSIIWNMIQSGSSLVYALSRFGAVLKEVEQDAVEAAGGEPPRLSYLKRSIDWEQFVNFLADPENAFKTAYNWNSSTDNFSAEALLKAIGAMFEMLPVASVVMDAPAPLYDKYFDSSLPTSPEKIEMLTIMPYILRDSNGDPIDLLKVSINAVPIPDEGTNTGSPCGIVIFPIISGSAQTSLSLGEGITLLLNGNYSSTPVNAEIRPGSVAIELPGSSESSLSASARVEAENEASPWVIVGSSDGPRFEVSKGYVEFAVSGTIQNPIFAIKTALDKAAVVIDFSSSDGFLQKVFGDSPQRINAELTVGWSSQGGFQISGGVVLDLTIPVHETLFNTITIDCVKIKLGADAADLKTHFNAGVVASLKLGPIDASVNNVGIKLGFKPTTDGSGNIGIFDVSLGFLPPTGAGLAIDTGAVVGGGYLEIDSENHRYAGILQIQAGGIGLVAIGLISTRMPDGSDGFSLLINIGVEFMPPIQLSYGFTLSGVGGLLGYNRTMKTDVLRDGLRNRTLDSILFPEDPIANAPKIISDLRAVFPPEEGRFVIGPMVKLGWGTPNIIQADIGIFIELPMPIRIALLGQIAAGLPLPEEAIVELHIDVLGIIEFDKQLLSIDATIYDSRIYEYTLTGDAALRLSWGDTPVFAMSLGGFHPRFSPPPNFPTLRCLTLNLSQGSAVQLYCKTYQALTSNSLQFGALVDLYASQSGATVEGNLTFDTLIYFSPFSFVAAMSGNVVARYKGHKLASVYISLNLSGPTPWNARGKASFEILFWDVDVEFNKTWGPMEAITLEAVDPWPPLKDALEANDSWGSKLPDRNGMVEMLAEIEEEGASPPLVLHPAGFLEIRQKELALGIRLDKVGNAPVKDHYKFDITKIIIGSEELDLIPVEEDFARGQFINLSDSEKLSRPSFEKMKAGVSASSDRLYFVKSEETSLTYESILIQEDRTSKKPTDDNKDKATLDWRVAKHHLSGNAARRSGLRTTGRRKFETLGKAKHVGVIKDGNTLVNNADMSPIGITGNDGTIGQLQAEQLLSEYLQSNPEMANEVAIVPSFEVAA